MLRHRLTALLAAVLTSTFPLSAGWIRAQENQGWFAFDPKPDSFDPSAATDLRFLNEKFAGENGFIGVKDGNFIHSNTGKPVRFWAVNGPPADMKADELGTCARMLAKHGVRSNTGELKLDYGKGVLVIDAPKAQGVSDLLDSVKGNIETRDLSITSDMAPGHIVIASLDDRPLSISKRMLLQVMSEERESGFMSEAVSPGIRRITALGADPWLVKNISGAVRFKRPDASKLEVTALDFNGVPLAPSGSAKTITLKSGTLYYLIATD